MTKYMYFSKSITQPLLPRCGMWRCHMPWPRGGGSQRVLNKGGVKQGSQRPPCFWSWISRGYLVSLRCSSVLSFNQLSTFPLCSKHIDQLAQAKALSDGTDKSMVADAALIVTPPPRGHGSAMICASGSSGGGWWKLSDIKWYAMIPYDAHLCDTYSAESMLHLMAHDSYSFRSFSYFGRLGSQPLVPTPPKTLQETTAVKLEKLQKLRNAVKTLVNLKHLQEVKKKHANLTACS